ncbi:helix-turn-helix domain-containing protein [Myxococcota bacterium]|jgi:cytoskeletal protein RodZ|nr:helix-turn-helix domain-containing protein [Myxococcota bacterium]
MNPHETTTARGPGSVLAAARLRAGLSLADVAARTRVARPLLEALEAEEWASLPAPVYVRGFIKLYAREVGLDARAVLRLLENQTEARVEAEVQAQTEAEAADRRATWDSIRWRAAYSMAVAIVVVVTLAALFSVSPPRLEARSLRPATGEGGPSGATSP